MVRARGCKPSLNTQKRLWASCGGYCQNPNCRTWLFSDDDQLDKNIGEMAHIVAASAGGPRGGTVTPESELGSFGNLILLCPTCHTNIDKSPDKFPQSEIERWKREGIDRVESALGAKKTITRADGRRLVEPLLATNKAIHERYGPESQVRNENINERATAWRLKVRSQIIPSSVRIIRICDQNRTLLYSYEKMTLELFRQHLDEITRKHLFGERVLATRFPSGMNQVFKG